MAGSTVTPLAPATSAELSGGVPAEHRHLNGKSLRRSSARAWQRQFVSGGSTGRRLTLRSATGGSAARCPALIVCERHIRGMIPIKLILIFVCAPGLHVKHLDL